MRNRFRKSTNKFRKTTLLLDIRNLIFKGKKTFIYLLILSTLIQKKTKQEHEIDFYRRGVRIYPSTVSVPYFLPKILRFAAKKAINANRTVFKIKTVLAF